MRRPRFPLFLACLWFFYGTALAGALEVLDYKGQTVRLESPALRIVSLTPTATEILYAVGAGSQIVGVTEYCNFPDAAKAKPKVGGFSGATVSAETIVALKPDLVLVSGDMHEKIASLLQKLGLKTFAIEPRNFNQVYQNILSVGVLTGHQTESEKVVADMKSRLARVSASIAGKVPKAVFWELWDDPLMSAGGQTFISEAIAAAGGRNIFADLNETWPTVSLEELLSRNCDWILAGDDHGDRMNLGSLLRRPGWSAIRAVKKGNIAVIEADMILRGGPRLVDAVEALERILR